MNKLSNMTRLCADKGINCEGKDTETSAAETSFTHERQMREKIEN